MAHPALRHSVLPRPRPRPPAHRTGPHHFHSAAQLSGVPQPGTSGRVENLRRLTATGCCTTGGIVTSWRMWVALSSSRTSFAHFPTTSTAGSRSGATDYEIRSAPTERFLAHCWRTNNSLTPSLPLGPHLSSTTNRESPSMGHTCCPNLMPNLSSHRHPRKLWARLQEFVDQWHPVDRALADLNLDDLLDPILEESDSVFRLQEDKSKFNSLHAELEILGCFSEFVVIARAAHVVLDVTTSQD